MFGIEYYEAERIAICIAIMYGIAGFLAHREYHNSKGGIIQKIRCLVFFTLAPLTVPIVTAIILFEPVVQRRLWK